MEYDPAAYQNYQDNFPSTKFLEKYFGQTYTIPGNPHRATVETDLYTGLRRLFGNVLRFYPGYFLDHQNCTNADFTPIYVFRDGVPEAWVDERLEGGGLMLELSHEAFTELGNEFIEHYRNGALAGRAWWRWKCEGNSIWIEVIPEAIAEGKHIRRPRTLKDLFSEINSIE